MAKISLGEGDNFHTAMVKIADSCQNQSINFENVIGLFHKV